MTQYGYTISDPKSGDRTSGVLVAPNYDAAFRILTERDFIVTQLAPMQPFRSKVLEWLGLMRRTISDEQLLALTEQMAAMLKAGLTLRASIDIVLNDTIDERFRQMLLEMSTSLGAGVSMTEVLSKYPDAFDRQYIALVSAGESGGQLAEVMARLASLIAKRIDMKKKVQTAMYYPAFVLTFAFFIMSALLLFGIPQFEEIYRGFGGDIPWATQLFVDLGKAARNHLGLITIALIAAVIGFRRLLRVERVAYLIDKITLRLPVIGTLAQRLAIARFARTLGTLHASGVAVVNSLDLVAASMNNRVLERVVRNARAQVMEGETLSAPLRRSHCFTEMSLSMMAAGEHSGSLDAMLANIADYYESQVDAALRGIASLVEPAVMVVVGLFVGLIMIVLVLPIFNLSTLLMTS